jgi:hypothetical protein
MHVASERSKCIEETLKRQIVPSLWMLAQVLG